MAAIVEIGSTSSGKITNGRLLELCAANGEIPPNTFVEVEKRYVNDAGNGEFKVSGSQYFGVSPFFYDKVSEKFLFKVEYPSGHIYIRPFVLESGEYVEKPKVDIHNGFGYSPSSIEFVQCSDQCVHAVWMLDSSASRNAELRCATISIDASNNFSVADASGTLLATLSKESSYDLYSDVRLEWCSDDKTMLAVFYSYRHLAGSSYVKVHATRLSRNGTSLGFKDTTLLDTIDASSFVLSTLRRIGDKLCVIVADPNKNERMKLELVTVAATLHGNGHALSSDFYIDNFTNVSLHAENGNLLIIGTNSSAEKKLVARVYRLESNGTASLLDSAILEENHRLGSCHVAEIDDQSYLVTWLMDDKTREPPRYSIACVISIENNEIVVKMPRSEPIIDIAYTNYFGSVRRVNRENGHDMEFAQIAAETPRTQTGVVYFTPESIKTRIFPSNASIDGLTKTKATPIDLGKVWLLEGTASTPT